ncbi:MAG: ribonuclease P protein component [Cyclobacteriaceae bacterium]|nr:ribonuclease P protein component [Cyclobacteriaceae bacterium]
MMDHNAHTSLTFTRDERLKSKKKIEELFKYGSFFRVPPLQVKYLACPSCSYHQVLIAVPKKFHKKAVVRNLLKRRIREAYRINKPSLFEGGQTYHLIAIMYLSKEILPFSEIEKKLIKLLKRLPVDSSLPNHEASHES